MAAMPALVRIIGDFSQAATYSRPSAALPHHGYGHGSATPRSATAQTPRGTASSATAQRIAAVPTSVRASAATPGRASSAAAGEAQAAGAGACEVCAPPRFLTKPDLSAALAKALTFSKFPRLDLGMPQQDPAERQQVSARAAAMASAAIAAAAAAGEGPSAAGHSRQSGLGAGASARGAPTTVANGSADACSARDAGAAAAAGAAAPTRAEIDLASRARRSRSEGDGGGGGGGAAEVDSLVASPAFKNAAGNYIGDTRYTRPRGFQQRGGDPAAVSRGSFEVRRRAAAEGGAWCGMARQLGICVG